MTKKKLPKAVELEEPELEEPELVVPTYALRSFTLRGGKRAICGQVLQGEYSYLSFLVKSGLATQQKPE